MDRGAWWTTIQGGHKDSDTREPQSTHALMKTVHVLQIWSYSYWKAVLTCEERHNSDSITLQVRVSWIIAAEYFKNCTVIVSV